MRINTIVGIGGLVTVLVLTGYSNVIGGNAPKSVKDRAAKMAAISLNPLTPVPAHSVERTGW